jgi:hypothetical protein
MHVRRIVLGLSLASLTGMAAAQPLTPQEARAVAEAAARSPESLPGSYQQVNERKSERGTFRTVVSTLRAADGQIWRRNEIARLSTDGTPEGPVSATIGTPEGTWRILPLTRIALFLPKMTPEEIKALGERLRTKAAETAAKRGKPEPPRAAPNKRVESKIDFKARAAEVEKEMVWSGERYQEGGRRLVRATHAFTDKGIELMQELAHEAYEEQKEQIPWFARAMAGAMLGPIMSAHLPVRTEYVIDEDRHLLLSTREFAQNGKMLREHQPTAFRPPGQGPVERVPDWPPETFAPPPQFEQIRAATGTEGLELSRRYSDAERAAWRALDPPALAPSAEPASQPEAKAP